MSRYTGAVCRVCRREGMKLFLKGERCYTDKCAIERRNYAPGQHGMRHSKLSDYGVQLREKQKVKRLYGLQERQFRRYFQIAARKKGITGEALLQMLERRLDNVVFVLGFAESRNQARQLVRHHHFTINGKKANIPSLIVREGDIIAVKEKSKKIPNVVSALESIDRRGIPAWLELNKEKMEGTVKSLPTRQDVTTQIQEQLIVELYSK